jgi:hypothetical protein
MADPENMLTRFYRETLRAFAGGPKKSSPHGQHFLVFLRAFH